jgi:hypothetical protein
MIGMSSQVKPKPRPRRRSCFRGAVALLAPAIGQTHAEALVHLAYEQRRYPQPVQRVAGFEVAFRSGDWVIRDLLAERAPEGAVR